MKILFLILLVLFPIQYSQAETLIEPYIGYNMASSLNIDQEESYSGAQGLGYGGRLGFQKLGFQIGLDYLHSEIDFDDRDFSKDLSMNEYAGFVAFEFPVLIRVYAGYIFAATGESSYGNGTAGQDFEITSGQGTKIGGSFTGLPFISLNLEYRNVKFEEYDLGNRTFSDEVDFHTYFLSVSLPFVF